MACGGDGRPTVTVEKVHPGEVTQTVSAPARVEAAAREEVVAAVSGAVIGIDVLDGGQVQAGQVVVRLSSPQVQAAQEQASAAAASAASAGGGSIRIDAGSRQTLDATGEAVVALDAETGPELAAARKQALAIRDPHARSAALRAVESAERAYDHIRSALVHSGQAVADGQRALADSVSAALRQALAQIAAPARASAAAARAAADAQQELLTLKAPFAGTVWIARSGGGGGALPGLPSELGGLAGGGLRAGSPSPGGGPLRVGSQVSPGQTLFIVYDLATMYMTADVDEADVTQIREGQPVSVMVDAVTDRAFRGVVERIAIEATTTESGGTGYSVRIRILAPGGIPPRGEDTPGLGDLRVGMTGSVEVSTRTRASDLVVPSRALLRRGGATVVFAVRDGVAVQVPVEVTALGEDSAAVTGSLRSGDMVVVAGYEDLRDAQPVRVR